MRLKVFIHIGKCGGSTCRNCIARNGIRIDEIVHIRKPAIAATHDYFVVARNPVDRAMSAFNWRRRLVVTDGRQQDRFPGEHAILVRYETLNDLAEDLYDAGGAVRTAAAVAFRGIHHLREDIDFYLGDLLRGIEADQIRGVIMQENLADDMQALFGVRPDEFINRNADARATRPLSPRARANLRRFLDADFSCLRTLRDWGKIRPESAVLGGLDG